MSDIETAKKLFFEGLDFFDLGDLHGAELKLLEARVLAPDNTAVLTNLAVVLAKLKKFSEAREYANQILTANKKNVEALLVLSTCCYHDKQFEEILTISDRINNIEPENGDAYNNRGGALVHLGRHEQALGSFQRALELNPRKPDYYVCHGDTLFHLKLYSEALENYDSAIALAPDFIGAWIGRGNVLLDILAYEDALAAFDKVLALNPDHAQAWFGRSSIFFRLNQDEQALACLEKAIALEPDLADAHFNKSLAKLSLGDYQEGWELYEWRWKGPSAPARKKLDPPLWLGKEDLTGKTILIHAEQGLGDSIFFSRYLKLLKTKGCEIIFEVQKPLVALMRSTDPDIRMIEQGAALPPFDFHCPLLSLPLAFGTTFDSIPSDVPYLFPSGEKIKAWHTKLKSTPATKPLIGLIWSGNANFRYDQSRRIPLKDLVPFLTENASWFALQKDIHPHDRDTLAKSPQIKLLSDSFADFSDTAAAIMMMDLVISIDTSVAHLAGALGKPLWVLLPFHADFRWLRNREDSPWYPSARLFRQKKEGEWADILPRLSEHISEFASARR